MTSIDTSRVGGVPYITFASVKSPKFAELAAQLPDLKEPDALLIRPVPYPPVILSPLKLHFLQGEQFWVESEDDGTVIAATREKQEWNSPFKEVIESLVLVYLNGGLLPARVSFRTTKTPGAKTLAKTLEAAASPEWATFSERHAASLAIPEPALRFTGTIACRPRTGQNGRRYYQSYATVRPTSGEEARAIVESLKDDNFKVAYAATQEAYNRRIEQLDGAHA